MDWLAETLNAAGLEAAARTAARIDVPGFVADLLVLLAAIAVAVALHAVAFHLLAPERRGTVVLGRLRRPLRIVAVVAALAVVVPGLGLGGRTWNLLEHGSLVALIVAAGWTLIVLVDTSVDRALRDFRLDAEDNLRARKYATQLRVLRRAAVTLIGILTGAAVLLTFDSVRQYGISLFASAGAAGLILGLAARPVLANLIAGIQIALTQPIRIDDVVIVEGEWGWIEEIFATYVVVRIWDWRRLVVPLSYFIEQPFQNWTRDSTAIIGAVFWYVDYTVPVDRVRAKMEQLVRASDNWDGQVNVLQVTDTDKDTITLRGLMSARTSPRAWDLRCEVREKLLMWLQAEYPGALPRLRGELDLRGPAQQMDHPAPHAVAGHGR